MGLIDVLNGMQNGPHGPRGSSSSSGGMSPITMAILGLLAYKAVKSFTSQTAAAPAGAPAPSPSPGGGGLGDILKGGLGSTLGNGLGGLLAGGAAGGVLNSGLNDLLKQFQQAGHGDVAKSWVDNGPNKSISSEDLAKALGADQIETLSSRTGLSQDDLLSSLGQYLPQVIDHLTPNGRVPTDHEMSQAL